MVRFITAILLDGRFRTKPDACLCAGFAWEEAFLPWYESCSIQHNNALNITGCDRPFGAATA